MPPKDEEEGEEGRRRKTWKCRDSNKILERETTRVRRKRRREKEENKEIKKGTNVF